MINIDAVSSSCTRTVLRTFSLASILSLVAGTGTALAAAEVRMPRLENLEKLTVGPDNHFQVAIAPSEERIYFTRSRNLATRLFWRGLKGFQALGKVEPFVKAEFDTKDPALSPDGNRIAYTSYESQARGDVCVQNISDGKGTPFVCAEEKAASEQPFWLGNQRIAFIRRPSGSNTAQLVSFDLNTREKKVLFEDQILSAHADASSRWIVYSSVLSQSDSENNIERGFKVFRISDQRTWPLKLGLPGLPGFPRFDEAAEFVYFAQFSNDTNADSRIDGNDNGLLYRIPVSQIEQSNTLILPEQLTTAEQNCNFPAPGKTHLYMTCAFEGSLDVYRLPKTGLVPMQWTEKNLLDAYRTSRNVAERTLIINTLRHRFEAYRNIDSFEKILSQHILTAEYQAALYYLDFVEASAPAAEKEGYKVLRNLLEVLQYRARERLDQISPEFVQLLAEKRSSFEKVKGRYHSLAQVSLGFVELSLRRNNEAMARFNAMKLPLLKSSMEQHLYLILAKNSLDQNLLPVKSWIETVVKVSEMQVVSFESSAFLGAQLLQKISEIYKSPNERLQYLSQLRTKVKADGVLGYLFRSQEILLNVALGKNDAEEDKFFAEFNKILGQVGDKYFLRRVVSTQGVLTLAEFNKTRVMAFIDSNWLSGAKVADTEYMMAREQYVSVTLDEGYAFWSQGKTKPASQVFYSAVRLTDDQESHLAYVTTLLQEGNRKLLDERYESLRKAAFTSANVDFAKAVIALFDDMERKELAETKLLDDAEKILTNLKDDGSRPAGKHLLLGYIAHQKMLRKMRGFTFDEELSQTAHHQYMIALDLARRSTRLTGRVLLNLGMLHLQTGNHGLASGFFAAREKIGFEDDNSRLSYLHHFSKALYRNGEFPRAAEVSTQGLELARKLKKEQEQLNGWMERTAFYNSQAGRFSDAVSLYRQLLGQLGNRTDENTIKAQFMTGWSLWHAGERKRASEHFDKVLLLADKLKTRRGQGIPGDVIDFHPDRYKALSYGFLVQLGNTPAARIPLRAERIKILSGWEDELKSYALSQENWARFTLKDCSAQATDLWLAGDHSKSKSQLEKCLDQVAEYADDADQSADEVVLETLRTAWMLTSRLAAKNVALSEAAQEKYFNLSRRALSTLDTLAGASRPMANRWLRLRAENLAARHVFLKSNQRDFVTRSDFDAQLGKLAVSDRIELLSAEERIEFARQVELVKTRVSQLAREK
jgi:hypothetical protein